MANRSRGGNATPVATRRTTNQGLQSLFFLLLLVAAGLVFAMTSAKADGFPRFRHVMVMDKPLSSPPKGVVRLLAEPDFAPWSFALDDGTMSGISVDLALLACEEAGLACEVLPTHFPDLIGKLLDFEGDAIISGMRISTEMETGLALTRPYFRSLSHFAARNGAGLAGADPPSLAAKRLGFVDGTLHGLFLQKYYGSSTMMPYRNEAELFEALRTGAIDAVFADTLRLGFWMKSEAARNCCVALGRPMVDMETITRPLVFMMRSNGAALRDRFDAALDTLDDTGRTGEVFKRYLPDIFGNNP